MNSTEVVDQEQFTFKIQKLYERYGTRPNYTLQPGQVVMAGVMGRTDGSDCARQNPHTGLPVLRDTRHKAGRVDKYE
jgi:hypothetical protein